MEIHWGGPWGVSGGSLVGSWDFPSWGIIGAQTQKPTKSGLQVGGWSLGSVTENGKETIQNQFLRRDLLIGKKMQPISVTPSKLKFKSGLQIDDLM